MTQVIGQCSHCHRSIFVGARCYFCNEGEGVPTPETRLEKLEALVARYEAALEAVGWFFLPQTTRGPGESSWLDAAELYLRALPSGEHAEDIRHLHAIARAPDSPSKPVPGSSP